MISLRQAKRSDRLMKATTSLTVAEFAALARQFAPLWAGLRAGQTAEGTPRQRQPGGWENASDVPSAPTFSRAFTAFAREEWTRQIHAEVIRRQVKPKLAGHVSL